MDTASAVSAYLGARKPEQVLHTSLTLAADSNPDVEAEFQRLSKAAGLPIDSVRDNAPAVKQRLAIPDTADLAAKFPSTTQYLSNIDNARIAHDDVGSLTAIEKAIRGFMDPSSTRINRAPARVMNSKEFGQEVQALMQRSPGMDADTARSLLLSSTTVDNQSPLIGPRRGPAPTVGNMLAGIFNLDQFRTTDKAMNLAAADILGLDTSAAMRGYQTAKARADQSAPEFQSATGEGIYSGLVSTMRNLPGIAASVLTGNPAPGLAFAGIQTGADAYGKYRARGATPGQAAVGGLLEGGVEVATELLPMSFLVKKLGKTGAKEFITGLLGRELPSEQLATLAQDAVDTAIANPEKTWAEFARERPGAAYQTLLATLVQSGAMGAAHTVATKITGYDDKTQRAEAAAARAQEFAGLVENSKLRQRDPDAFKQFVEQVAESGDTPGEFFIDAEQLANSLNQSAVTIEELRAIAPQVAAQLEAAKFVPGADIRVPVAEFAAAPSEVTTPLLDHLREAPDAMSRAEAQAFLKDAGPKIARDVESALTDTVSRADLKAATDKVTLHFQEQLDAVGKFRPEVNKAYASVLGNFYATQAARSGMPVDEFLERYQLKVASKDAALGGKQRLEQAGGLDPNTAAAAVQTLQNAGLGNLQLVESVDQLPEQAQRKIKSEGAAGTRGMYDPATDTTYLVRSNITSLDEAFWVGLHEAFHRGLRKTVGDEVAPLLQAIHDGNARVQALTARYMQSQQMDQLEAIEEVLADMAGQGEAGNLKGWEQLIAFLKDAIVKLAKAAGVQVEITDEMVTDLVAGMRRAGMQDSPAKQRTVIELRKREKVLESLLECLGAA